MKETGCGVNKTFITKTVAGEQVCPASRGLTQMSKFKLIRYYYGQEGQTSCWANMAAFEGSMNEGCFRDIISLSDA